MAHPTSVENFIALINEFLDHEEEREKKKKQEASKSCSFAEAVKREEQKQKTCSCNTPEPKGEHDKKEPTVHSNPYVEIKYVQEKKQSPVDVNEQIKEIRFNGPATIIFWLDGTKTIAVCGKEDIFDPEKGIAIAMLKKYVGNTFMTAFNEIEYDIDEKYDTNKEIVNKLLETKKLTEEQKEAIRYFIEF